MKNHKINYKKYITLIAALTLTFVGVATVSDTVNSTKYEVTDTNVEVVAEEEKVVAEDVEESEETPVNNESSSLSWDSQIEGYNQSNELFTEKGYDTEYNFSSLKSEDGNYEMFIADLDAYMDSWAFIDSRDEKNKINIDLYVPENIPNDATFKYKLSDNTFDAIVGKDINLPSEKYKVKYSDIGTDMYDVQITADGYLIVDNFNEDVANRDASINFESLDLRPGLNFLEASDEMTFEVIEGGLAHSFDPTVGSIVQSTSIIGFSLSDGQFPEFENEIEDYDKLVTQTGEVDWNTVGTYTLTYVLRYENPLQRFDVTDTYTVTVNVKPKADVETPKPETPDKGLSTPELTAEPLKIATENRDFKGLEELIYEAYDEKDGNLNSSVIIKSGTVNISKIGRYSLILEVTNSDGNTAEEEVIIEVFEAEEEPEVVVEDEPDVVETEVVEPDVEKEEVVVEEEIIVEVEKEEVTSDPKVEEVEEPEPETAKEQPKEEVVTAIVEEEIKVADNPAITSDPKKEEPEIVEDVEVEEVATEDSKKDSPTALLQTDITDINQGAKNFIGLFTAASGIYLFKIIRKRK